MANKSKLYLICGICSFITFLVMLGFGIFTAAFLNNILLSQAAQKVQMTPSTYQNWGQVPGGYNANVTRNYTFFNFTNPWEVFYLNHTPEFTELRGQLYQENQNLMNPVYSPDDTDGATSVSFDFQMFTTDLNTSPDDLVTTINLGSLGFWYSVPRLPDSQIASYALAALIFALELDIVTTLQSAAIQFECAKDFNTTVDSLFNPSGITDPDLQSMIWNDPINGLGNLSTIVQWVHAVANGPDSGAAKILGDYFYLNYTQIQGLFQVNGTFYKCIDALNTSISNGYGCDSVPCHDNYFVIDQWATQQITQHPAGGIIPAKDSVTFYNTTVSGYPEISYYFSEYFFVQYPDLNQSDFSNVTFTIEQAALLLNYNTTPGAPGNYCTDQTTLLHMGNLAFLYEYGQLADASSPLNLTILQPVVDRFQLNSTAQAYVLWKYVLYFQSEFAEKNSINGTASEVIMGMFASTALYYNFTTFLDNVPLDLTARIIQNNLTANGINCTTLFDSSSILIQADDAQTICTNLTNFTLDTIKTLYTVCSRPNSAEYHAFLDNVTITRPQLFTFCNTMDQNTFANFSLWSDQYLKSHYNCSQNISVSSRCSRNELAVMQWGGSIISQNPPEMLNFNSSLTISDWYPELIPKAFEYLPVLAKLNASFGNDTSYTNPIPYNISNKLMTFDSLFNEVVVQTAMISYKNQDWKWFEDVLFGITPYHIVTYFRYIMMEIALGGFYQTRTVKELLWGYEDPLLTFIKSSSPYNSGDPSINNYVNLTGGNCSDPTSYQFQATMLTGTNDSLSTRKFVTINGLNTITFNNTYFNGNESTYELISPWGEDIPLQGTDGVINHPGLDSSDTVPIYISDANYQTNLVYSGATQDYSGLEAYRYVLSSTALQNSAHNPDNSKYYSDVWDGLINVSQAHKAPLFISKSHFLDADQLLQDAVTVYSDSSKTTKTAPSTADNLYVDIEPYSGAAVGTLASLQINYEFKQDSLISNPNYAMLPLMYTQRYMAFTEDQVSDVYGPLVTGLSLKDIGPKVFFPLAALFLLVTIFCVVRRRMLLKKRVEDGSYGRMLGVESRAQPLDGYLSSREHNDSSVENQA